MNQIEALKNRLPIEEMKDKIVEFCETQKSMYIGYNDSSDFPMLEVTEYRYLQGKHIVILPETSMFLSIFEDGFVFTGFIYSKDGIGAEVSNKIYGKFHCKKTLVEEDLHKLINSDELAHQMYDRGAKFFVLEVETATAYFGYDDMFNLDRDLNVTFAEYTPSGKKRYENSRCVVISYMNKDVILNALIEDDVYYILTTANSHKVSYIKDGGTCKVYDGRDNHFIAEVEILESSRVSEIFRKFEDTNSGFFKTSRGLVALSFKKA